MEIRILGPLEVSDDGRVVELGAGRQRALLALLALHAPEIVATDRLIEELWAAHPRRPLRRRSRTSSRSFDAHSARIRSQRDLPATAFGSTPTTSTRGGSSVSR